MRGGDFLKYTVKNILSYAMSLVSNDLDKREGSIIYDALAPFSMVVSKIYYNLYEYYKNTYAYWSEGEYLDYRVAERGLTRYPATYAIKLGYFTDENEQPMSIPLGSEFCTVDEQNPIYYTTIEPYKVDGVVQVGYYLMQCQTIGTIGNIYTGDLVNITFIYGISTATLLNVLPITPARDVETDNELRIRYFENLKAQAFGGNRQDYKEKVLGIEGVGAVQIYPVWDGGGTVKLSVISPDYNIVSNEFLTQLKEIIDPANYEGEGVGLAPIGHHVTIVTATEKILDIDATIEYKTGYTIEMLQASITQAINEYLLSVRQEWAVEGTDYTYTGKVYISRISNAILNVPGVVNVTDVSINGSELDLTLQEDSTIQELTVLGTVTLHEIEV